jgi:hypothetical protein
MINKKNKTLTYLLFVVVILVWSLIIYRVIAAYSGGSDDADVPTPPAKEVFNDYALPKDTDRLLLNYKDPFGLGEKKDTIKHHTSVNSVVRMPVLVAKPIFNWAVIQYAGYIRNPDSKKLLAFMHINGKESMMKEGETIDRIKLIHNMRDSVLVSHEGQNKYIRLKPAI